MCYFGCISYVFRGREFITLATLICLSGRAFAIELKVVSFGVINAATVHFLIMNTQEDLLLPKVELRT